MAEPPNLVAQHHVLKHHEVHTLAELALLDTDGDVKPQHQPFKGINRTNLIDLKHLPLMANE